MTREEKVSFIVWAISEIEGVQVQAETFKHKTDDELDKEVEWYDYLLDK